MSMVALRAALLCEIVLTEASGLRSPIRIFSRLSLPPGAAVDATLLVMLANTEVQASAEHQLVLRVEDAAGTALAELPFAVTSPLAIGETFDLVVPFSIVAPQVSTLRWLRLSLDGQLLTCVPLHIEVTAGE
jgi:hypothetical protein